MPIMEGDLLRVMTPGGGGWGDPLDREPEKVVRDVALGQVSMDSAKQDYGVVMDPHRLEVLEKETTEQRERLRRSRPPLAMIDRGERFEKLLAEERISLTSPDSVL